ncbi:MAG: hypothetical protein H7336_00155 [Bacteriovorax sp.]|nr:hypothetical protein [Bacteriovorax sp.]
MKKIILLAAISFSSSIFAASVQWSDLEQYNGYKITQKLVFENGVTLPAGDVYELNEIEALSIPGYPMMLYGFHKKNCTTPDQTADISIVEVPGQDWDVEVGIQLEEGCNLGVYLEVKDLYSGSTFGE